jgi:hypothetical protein
MIMPSGERVFAREGHGGSRSRGTRRAGFLPFAGASEPLRERASIATELPVAFAQVPPPGVGGDLVLPSCGAPDGSYGVPVGCSVISG